jgi:hypothetical protein
MCESEYGAGRPLELQSFTDIVPIYTCGIAFIKRSPIVSITSVSVRTKSSFGTSDWQPLTSNDYFADTEINQINIRALDNWGMSGHRRSHPSEAKVTYTSGFDFSTDTSQEANNIRAVCGRIVSYMEQPVAIGKYNVTDTNGFQSYVSGDSFLGLFLLPLAKYKPRG